MLTQALIGEAIGRAMQSERLPPAALEELRQRRFRELAQFAAERSPFYARHYAGIDLERVPLTELPPVTKKLVQEHFDEVVTDPRVRLAGVKEFCRGGGGRGSWYLDAFAVLMSSGTSGERGYFVLDGPALADAIALGYRQSNRGAAPAGAPPPPQRIAAVMLVEPFDAAGLLMRMIPESVGPKLLLDIRQDFPRVCAELNAFQPTLLSSFPYVLRMLAAAASEGRLGIRPTRITSSGDVLTESDRARVRAAFGVAPHDYYCSTEAPYVAWECDEHEGLHVNADSVVVESVDAANRPVPSGRLGEKLLLTNLANRALPLLRYEMSDQVELADGRCRCGCLLPRLRKVAGRVEHVLVFPAVDGGRAALIPEYLDEFIGGLDGLTNYQVIQEAPAKVTVNFIADPRADAERVRGLVGEALDRCFRRYGVAPGLAVEFRPVERLEPIRPGSSKVCHYWNRSGREGQA